MEETARMNQSPRGSESQTATVHHFRSSPTSPMKEKNLKLEPGDQRHDRDQTPSTPFPERYPRTLADLLTTLKQKLQPSKPLLPPRKRKKNLSTIPWPRQQTLTAASIVRPSTRSSITWSSLPPPRSPGSRPSIAA